MRIWAFLRRLMGGRSARREIFRYFDGQAYRYADPLLVLQALDATEDWQELIQAAIISTSVDPAKLSPVLRAQVEDKSKLIGDLAGVVREVFGLKVLGPDGGLTQLECVDLLSDFLAWCASTSRDYRPLLNLPARPATSPEDTDTGEYVVSTSTATSSGVNGP